MKKLLMAMILVLGIATSGWAITYDLTYIIDGGPPVVGPVTSLGTVTIVDNAADTNKVEVTVDLADSYKLLGFLLNYQGTALPTNLAITGATLAPPAPSTAIDTQFADGYKGAFDIQIPETGNLGNVNSFTGTISATTAGGTAINLDPTSFAALDTLGFEHVAAHIGAGGGTLPGVVNSLWAGDGPTSVPEPTTMLLLGLGLVGLAGVGRKFKK